MRAHTSLVCSAALNLEIENGKTNQGPGGGGKRAKATAELQDPYASMAGTRASQPSRATRQVDTRSESPKGAPHCLRGTAAELSPGMAIKAGQPTIGRQGGTLREGIDLPHGASPGSALHAEQDPGLSRLDESDPVAAEGWARAFRWPPGRCWPRRACQLTSGGRSQSAQVGPEVRERYALAFYGGCAGWMLRLHRGFHSSLEGNRETLVSTGSSD
jgi:hypothetical protein